MISKKNKEELLRLVRAYGRAMAADAADQERHELNLDRYQKDTDKKVVESYANLAFFVKHNL